MSKVQWMSGHYGIMVHFLSHIGAREGNKKLSPDAMADTFDVKKFADEAEKMGASWVIFPFGQNTGFYWSKNPYLEERVPNCCSRRDLIMELADELISRNMRFIAYLPTEMDAQNEVMRAAFAWDESSDKKEFMRRYIPVVRYYAEKFGKKISGWWFDGCYTASEKCFLRTRDWSNERFDKKLWFEAAKAGNLDAAIAMCNGANHMSCVFWEEEEYLPGEVNDLTHVPWEYDSEEKQWHALTWLDCSWMLPEGEKMPEPKYSDEELFGYVKACLEKRGAVTLNIGIYEDGTLAEKTVEQVLRMKHVLKN